MVVGTGDLKNSVTRLRALLKATRYPHAQVHANGTFAVADLLRILHHALLDYSRHVAAFVLEKGYDLYGKTDARFIDHCFRLLRDEFQYFPSMNSSQFLSPQFLERKVQLVGDILDVVVKKHDECVRRRRQAQAVWTKPRELKTSATHIENHVIPPPPPTGAPTVDTWSLLEHFRQEAKENARAQKRAAAERVQQKREHYRASARYDDAPTRTVREHSARRSSSPTNQRGSSSDASDANSATDSEPNARKNPQASDSSVSADHRARTCGCDCGDTKAEVHEVIVTLGKQLSDLTAAVLSRVSAIESRLGRVEEQLQDLQVTKSEERTATDPPTRNGYRYAPISRTKAALSTASSSSSTNPRTDEATAVPRTRSAWPPAPELFNLS